MIAVNSPKPEIVVQTFDQQEIEGLSFQVVRVQGLSVMLAVSGDEQKAKNVIQKVLKQVPAMKYQFISVMLVDDSGRPL